MRRAGEAHARFRDLRSTGVMRVLEAPRTRSTAREGTRTPRARDEQGERGALQAAFVHGRPSPPADELRFDMRNVIACVGVAVHALDSCGGGLCAWVESIAHTSGCAGLRACEAKCPHSRTSLSRLRVWSALAALVRLGPEPSQSTMNGRAFLRMAIRH
eukprot:2342560-Pleurochrysis_carterae.AAC.2